MQCDCLCIRLARNMFVICNCMYLLLINAGTVYYYCKPSFYSRHWLWTLGLNTCISWHFHVDPAGTWVFSLGVRVPPWFDAFLCHPWCWSRYGESSMGRRCRSTERQPSLFNIKMNRSETRWNKINWLRRGHVVFCWTLEQRPVVLVLPRWNPIRKCARLRVKIVKIWIISKLLDIPWHSLNFDSRTTSL